MKQPSNRTKRPRDEAHNMKQPQNRTKRPRDEAPNMKQPQNITKRPSDESPDKSLKFIPGLPLSKHPPEQRKDLFLQKLKDVAIAKSLHPTEFEGYTIRERFAKMGWEQLLNFDCDKIYRQVVIQWTASLSRNGDELTGIVNGKSYTITPTIIRDLLKVDTCTGLPYARFDKTDFRTTTAENKRRWVEACKTVFGTHKVSKETNGWYLRSNMTPLVKVLWRIGASTFHPRFKNTDYVEAHQIYLLHALFTGDYLYSFAHMMIDDIWDMYEHERKKIIPHGYYISVILKRLGAVSKEKNVEVVSPPDRLISRESFVPDLKFSESPTAYIIDDSAEEQRVTIPKKVKEREVSSQMPVPDPHLDMTKIENLINNQSSQFQKQHHELITMVTNLQKQIEHQAKDTERREQEIERRAEIRAHAIIWDIERQRYLYEQEQRQLRMAWNKGYGVNGGDEFQFPHMSHTSFHPPRDGSKYYVPAQGDEIPKAFQSLYRDIYGPGC